MRPGPEHLGLAGPFSVDALSHGGQQHPLLHQGQQCEQLGVLWQRGRRVREQNACKSALHGGGCRWDGGGRLVHYPEVGALDVTLEDLLARITDLYFEGVLDWRAERGRGQRLRGP